MTELVAGKAVDEAIAITKETVAEKIGGLPAASGHAAQLAVDAVRAVVKKAITHG
jgi:nitrogen fixation protein NifU and related proteins